MAERLTLSCEDGTTAKLRELAGGERKVGAFLTQVTHWLYQQREVLESEPLDTLALSPLANYQRMASRLRVLETRVNELENRT